MRLQHVLIVMTVAVTLMAYGFSGQEDRLSPLTGPWRPFFGFEHVLAVVGVAAWAAILRGHAFWALPAGFLTGAALGFAVAWDSRGELPFVGLNLLLSIVALALVVLMPVRVPPMIAAIFVALFGIYHGYAYRSEPRINEVEENSARRPLVMAREALTMKQAFLPLDAAPDQLLPVK